VRIVRAEARLGYAPANNLGFREATGRFLIVLNPDTRVAPGFVAGLVAASAAAGDQALVTSRICLFDRPDEINTCGNTVNFGLIAACRGLGEPADRWGTADEVASISGCAFLVPRPLLEQLGPFEEAIYPYLEDTEISLRAWVGGFRCVTAPESVVYHKYAIRLKPEKFFFIERNRWLVMLQTYRWRTLAVLLPGLLLTEGLVWAGAATMGTDHLRAKARSYAAIARMLPVARQGRRRTQRLRRRDDRSLLARLDGPVPVAQLATAPVAKIGLTVANAVLAGYFGGVRRLVRW